MLKHTLCTVLLYLVNVISTGIHFIECNTCLLYSYFYKSENKFAQELSLWNVQSLLHAEQKNKLILRKGVPDDRWKHPCPVQQQIESFSNMLIFFALQLFVLFYMMCVKQLIAV